MPELVKANILIVDDKPANIYALEELLARPDRRFIRAMNGNDALKIVLQEEIDLIILDVQMPDMDGFEVAQILKSHKRTKDIPVIFASAEKKEQKFMLKGFDEGAVDYLYKPLDAALTSAKVNVLLQLHLQKKELVRKNLLLEKYALLINNSADIICIVNARSLTFEEVNNAVAAILGYTPDELRNSTIPSMLAEEDRSAVHELVNNHQSAFSFEARAICKDGTVKWLNWNVVAKDGMWFANARDITQQKDADREIRQLNADLHNNIGLLEAANKELESFSYSISHDLRAPLRSINGYSRIILDEHQEGLDADLRRLLGNIQHNATRMGVLIDNLLEFSRLGQRRLNKIPVDMAALAQRVVQEMEEASQKKADIRIGMLPAAEGDPALLYQVMINLVSNALKYSGKKEMPRIDIGALEDGDKPLYYVKDNGVGFNMEYAHKLFGVFQRLHGNDEFEGVGVGLAIVQRIINRHGGRIWAESTPNEGATFFFSLPILKTEKQVLHNGQD